MNALQSGRLFNHEAPAQYHQHLWIFILLSLLVLLAAPARSEELLSPTNPLKDGRVHPHPASGAVLPRLFPA